MNNQIEGVITRVLPIQKGTGKNGKEWKSVDFVVSTNSQYPKTVCMSLFGDKVDQFGELLKEGSPVVASIDIESREYNNRYFTSVRAYKLEKMGEAQPNQQTNYDQQAQQFFANQPAPNAAPQQQPQYPNPNGNGLEDIIQMAMAMVSNQ